MKTDKINICKLCITPNLWLTNVDWTRENMCLVRRPFIGSYTTNIMDLVVWPHHYLSLGLFKTIQRILSKLEYEYVLTPAVDLT